jgi:hypothetical protein
MMVVQEEPELHMTSLVHQHIMLAGGGGATNHPYSTYTGGTGGSSMAVEPLWWIRM